MPRASFMILSPGKTSQQSLSLSSQRPDLVHLSSSKFLPIFLGKLRSLQFLAVSATFPPPLVALAEDLFVHVCD